MARRRNTEPSLVDTLFHLFVHAPPWFGPVAAGIAFVLFRWILPLVFSLTASSPDAEALLGPTIMLATKGAPFIAIVVLLLWAVALFKRRADRARLEAQTGLKSIERLPWPEFESLLATAFRREGFVVQENARPGAADGGVDLRLEKAGAVTLVQCKQWRTKPVGVKIVRELLGVVASERAASGIVVTCGNYTPDAVAFAEGNPIRLIDGPELERMIHAVQRSAHITRPTAAPTPQRPQPQPPGTPPTSHPAPATVTCPTCNAPMVRRTAKTGPHAGKDFLGCTRYPACRGIRQAP